MQTLTAILRAKPGHEETVKAALLKVGAYVRAHEPATLGFFVAQDPDDPCRFTTYERFTDRARWTGTTTAQAQRVSSPRRGISSTARPPS
jgi:quinol monooxygenase YgiN